MNIPETLKDVKRRLLHWIAEMTALSADYNTFKTTYNNSQPLRYKATVTQTGTGVPTATILENTLGQIPSYVRNGAGDYELNVTDNILVKEKTYLVGDTNFDWYYRYDDETISFGVGIEGGGENLESYSILIEIYP